jgi:hypothetical protein
MLSIGQTSIQGLSERAHSAASCRVRSATGLNSWASLPWARSAHGSFWAKLLGEDEAIVEGAAALAVLHDLLADGVEADALCPFVDALEVAALLAIELGQRADHLDRLLLGGDVAQKLGALDLEAGGAGVVDVVAGLDAEPRRCPCRSPRRSCAGSPRPRA